MIRSMTGYGEAARESAAGRLRLEVKTVNHRFFNPSIKTPSGFDRFERDIAEVLKQHLARGHVSAFLSVDRSALGPAAEPQVDLEKARSYKEALEAMGSALGIPGNVDLSMIARFNDVFRAPDGDRTEGIDAGLIRSLAEEAAVAVRSLRESEGARLYTDLAGRLEAMSVEIDRVETRAPVRLRSERDRLRAAVQELTEQIDVDEDRLAREIAYLAERWDINEEIVRFRAHIDAFREAMEGDGAEPIGKRLGFLVQEMHREANTVGSKANDSDITLASVALKEDIERLREQVENIE